MEKYMCRICLRKAEFLQSIFTNDNNNVSICEKIMQCGGVWIKKGTNTPELICQDCLDKLQIAYDFRTMCKKSDNMLQLVQKADFKNNIFVTLANGRTYRLPVDLKLTIVKSPAELKEKDKARSPSETHEALKEQMNEVSSTDEEDANETFEDAVYLSSDNSTEFVDVSNNLDSSKEEEKLRKDVTVPKTRVRVPSKRKEIKRITQISGYKKYKSSDEDNNSRTDDPPTEPATVRRIRNQRIETPRVYVCDMCGNHYKQMSQLEIHMRRHRNEKPYPCELCSKRFVSSALMARHMKRHTGVKPFQCQYCSRKFYERGSCRAHEKVHTGEIEFPCQTCGKIFRYSHGLKKHMLIHTGQKLYRCDECGKEFRLAHHLKQHLSTMSHQNNSLQAEHIN